MIIVGMIVACLTMVVAFVVMTGMIVVIVRVIVTGMIVMVVVLGRPTSLWGRARCIAASRQHRSCGSHQESSQRKPAHQVLPAGRQKRTEASGSTWEGGHRWVIPLVRGEKTGSQVVCKNTGLPSHWPTAAIPPSPPPGTPRHAACLAHDRPSG